MNSLVTFTDAHLKRALDGDVEQSQQRQLFGATNFIFTYDDNAEGDVTVATTIPVIMRLARTKQPKFSNPITCTPTARGTLQDFAAKKALGVWMYTMTDNALTHTGQAKAPFTAGSILSRKRIRCIRYARSPATAGSTISW